MKANLYFIILVFFAGCQGKQQLSIKRPNGIKKEITGIWEIKNGWFNTQNLMFERTSDSDQVFKFKKNRTIEYLYKPGDCDVGVLTLIDGSWNIEGEILTIELRGYKITDYYYWYKTRYKLIQLDRKNMILELLEIIKYKEDENATSVDDLMKD